MRPYANPTETYEFYKLPFCKPKERNWDDHELGELLTGSRKVLTDYKLYFGVDQSYAQLCRVAMTPDVVQAFRDAVDEDYEISASCLSGHLSLVVVSCVYMCVCVPEEVVAGCVLDSTVCTLRCMWTTSSCTAKSGASSSRA